MKETYAGIPIGQKRIQQSRLTLEKYIVELDTSDPPRGEISGVQFNTALAIEAIEVSEKLEELADYLHDSIKEFLKQRYNKVEIRDIAREAREMDAKTADKILHLVIAPNMIN